MSKRLSSFSYSSDGKYLLGYSEESGEIHLLDANSKKVLISNTVKGGQTISSVSFCNQDKNYIVVSKKALDDINTNEFTITLYDTSSGEKVADTIFDKCNNVYIAPDQTKAFVQTTNETTYEVIQLNLIDLSQNSLFTTDSLIQSCSISRDSSHLAIRCTSNIVIYNLKDGSSYVLEGMFSSITLGNTSKSLCAINSDTMELQIYSMEDWSLIHSQPVSASTVDTMQYDLDDKNLLISYGDRSIEVFDCKTWKRVPSFENYKNDMFIDQILFPENTDYIILYGPDQSYICTSSFEVLACIPDLLDYREDLKEVVVSSNTELVRFPFYNLDMLLAEAKTQLDGRTLTNEEMSELFIN